MFLQRFFISLLIWIFLSCTAFNVMASPSFSSYPINSTLITFISDVSGTSVSQLITISNSSSVDPLVISSYAFGLTNPSNFSIPNAFPLTIPAGSFYEMIVTCNPDMTSYLTYANLVLSTNDPAKSSVFYPLACTKNSTGILYESYPPKNTAINSFGDVNVGSSKTRSGIIFNAGDTAMTISSLTFSGTDASSFNVAQNPISPLSGGSNTYFIITCSPTKVGLLEANLVVNTNASNVSSIVYGLTCNGTGNSAPTDISLDNQSINGGSVAGTFVGNLSTIDPNVTDTHTYSLLNPSGMFTIQNNKLFTSQTMPLSVSGGFYSVTIVSTDNGGLSSRKTFNINVIPKVGPRFKSNPSSDQLINLGKTLVLTSTLSQPTTSQLEVIEDGDMDLRVSATINGTTNATDFSVSPNSIVVPNGGSSQFFTISCLPSTKGIRYAQLQLVTNSSSSPTTFIYPLQCEGLAGASFTSNPLPNQTWALGKTPIGQMISRPLQITETGDMDLKLTATLKGTDRGDFSISSSSMNIPDGGTSQEFAVKCTPSKAGILKATLELSSNDPKNPLVSYLLECEGSDNTPKFTSVPPLGQSIQVGKIQVNQTVKSDLKITETGTTSLQLSATITGIDKRDFKVSPTSMTLPDGSPSQNFTIECTPSKAGILKATLELSSNDPKNPLVSYLLECEGSDNTPKFTSVPPLGQSIQVGKIQVNQTVKSDLKITETGTTGLQLSATITGIDKRDFKVSPTSMTLPDGSPSQNFTIECTPSKVAILNAVLELSATPISATLIPSPTSYPLTCEGTAGAMFNSNPSPNSLITFNSNQQNTPVSQSIQIANRSNQNLSIDSLEIGGGLYANGFNILNGGLPINIAPQTSFSLTLQCTPTNELLQGGILHLTTNDPNNLNVNYPLACLKRAMGSIYVSLPRVEESIYFNNVAVGRSEIHNLFVMNAGDTSFSISDISITGANADIFHIPAALSLPVTINPSDLYPIDIICNPAQEGLFTADLTISANAATARRIGTAPTSPPMSSTPTALVSAHYSLVCRSGVNNQPTDILLSSEWIKPNTLANTLVAEISTIDPDINDPQTYTLQDSSGLFVVKGHQLWTTRDVPTNSSSFDVSLTTTDSGGLSFQKDFHLTIGDISQQFKADVITDEGIKTLVDETELLTVKGYIKPLAEEVGKTGDVFVIYQYTSLSNGIAKLPITLLQNVPLQANIEVLLYQGRLIYLPGKIDIVLGYRINDNETKGLANSFSVRRNRPPSDLSLSRNTLAERSVAGTTIGTLVAQDADRNDFFRYVLTKNPGTPFGYFRIVGDQLQMTESFPLTFTNNSTLDVGVRVIDGAGGYLDKTFTVNVIENTTPHIGGEIRSNGYAIRGTKEQLATLMKEQPFTVNAWIQPPSIHINKKADILYKIVYTPVSGNQQTFEGIWKENVTLSSAIDIEMAKDAKLSDAGIFDISIGYKLKEGDFQVLTSFQKFRIQG